MCVYCVITHVQPSAQQDLILNQSSIKFVTCIRHYSTSGRQAVMYVHPTTSKRRSDTPQYLHQSTTSPTACFKASGSAVSQPVRSLPAQIMVMDVYLCSLSHQDFISSLNVQRRRLQATLSKWCGPTVESRQMQPRPCQIPALVFCMTCFIKQTARYAKVVLIFDECEKSRIEQAGSKKITGQHGLNKFTG